MVYLGGHPRETPWGWRNATGREEPCGGANEQVTKRATPGLVLLGTWGDS